MPDLSTLAIVATASLALAVFPGPAVFYIVTRSITQGRAAGLVSVAGIHVGTLFHIAAAVLGLPAVLMRFALAFNTVKYAGAVYLIYLGIRTLRMGDGLRPARRSGGNHLIGSQAGFRGEYPQPQDRPLLLSVPAAIR